MTAPLSVRPSVRLLGDAEAVLARARAAGSVPERFCLAHLAALRGAAAVLAARARPAAARGGGSAWLLLGVVAPELGEWAEFFAAGAPKRAAAGAGIRGAVTPREADDLVRQAGLFLATVGRVLAVPAAGPA